MLKFSNFVRYDAIYKITCYITLKCRSVSALFSFSLVCWQKVRLFLLRKIKNNLVIVCRGDELQYAGSASKSEYDITNADDSE